MKKKFVLFVLLICLTTSCNLSYTSRTTSVSSASINMNSDIIEEGKNYKIIASEKDDHIQYQYWVFNNNGDVMYKGTLGIKPDFKYLDNDILRQHNGSGNVSQYQFFDIQKNLTSPIYDNPSLVENGKIVYMTFEDGKIKLILSDLFDKSKFYKEYERDFSPVAVPYNDLISAKFIDSNKLQITYLTGSDFKEVTEIIELK